MLAIVALLLASCGSGKDVPYLINANQLPQDVLNAAARMNDPTLMPGDMLQINVSGPDADAVKPFNKTEYVNATHNYSSSSGQDNSIFYYVGYTACGRHDSECTARAYRLADLP